MKQNKEIIQNSKFKILSSNKKLACVTIDYELDYGDRTEQFNILNENSQELDSMSKYFKQNELPISAFIRTDMFEKYPESFELVKKIANDYHVHSHTHNTKNFDSQYEIKECKNVFTEYFGYEPLGYRAPQGVLYEGDIDILKDNGYKFSSSVFPAYRPGKFNNISMPQEPFYYDNGLMEIPLAVVPYIKLIISLSYIKLLGYNTSKLFYSIFGLPKILILDTHLHDFIFNQKSFSRLPKKLQIAWGRNRYNGMKYFDNFIKYLKRKGYKFTTMSDIYHSLNSQKENAETQSS